MGDGISPRSDLIVYVDRSDIREGRIEDLKAGVRRLVEFIESHEPQLIDYSFHLDEDAGRMIVVAVHPDSASLELHQEVGGPEFRKLGDLVTLRQIEVFGAVSEKARGLLHQKAAALGGAVVEVHDSFAGFSRPS